jgi:hypothetical protein
MAKIADSYAITTTKRENPATRHPAPEGEQVT